MNTTETITLSEDTRRIIGQFAPLHETEVMELVRELVAIDTQIRPPGPGRAKLSEALMDERLERARVIIHFLGNLLTGERGLVEVMRVAVGSSPTTK